MLTNKLGLPTITNNMNADIPRDLNALAQAVDDKAGAPNGLARLGPNGKLLSGQENVVTPVIATESEARAGSINNKYMSPLRVKEAINSIAEKNVPNGYAGLGPDGLLPDSLFPTNTTKAMYGQYVGDGQSDRLIPLGFSPKIMIVIRKDSYYGIISYSFVNELGYLMTYAGGQVTHTSGKGQRIVGSSLLGGMNNNNSLNASGAVYEYMAYV